MPGTPRPTPARKSPARCAAPSPTSPPRRRSPHDEPTLLVTTRPPTPPGGLLPEIAGYRIVGELGRGGMGIVYKATTRGSSAAIAGEDRTVAIKVIRKDRLQHDDAVRRFRREAQAAARLNHPNIVRVFDSDHTGDTHYLVMEYVSGVTLERFVQQHGPVPYELACNFIRQAALGLAHAHERGLVHRDVKPSNLMVTPASGRMPDGSPAQLKILDMGVARVLASDSHPGEQLSTLTQGGSVIGTADFVAPELLEDPHGADIRSDIYSLGCTFYFILVGEVPFPGGSLVQKLDKQRWHMPTPVDEVRADILPAVAEIVTRMLAKEPDERYQSPAELVAAFDELVRTGYQSSVPKGPVPCELKVLAGHTDIVHAVGLTADARLAVSTGRDRSVRLWDLHDPKHSRVLAQLPHEGRAVAFDAAGDKLAVAAGISIRLWDVAAGQELRRFSGHSAAVRALVFSTDGKWLFSGSDDKTIRVWDVPLGKEVQRLARHSGPVTCLAVSPDGHGLLSGSRDGLKRWDLRSGQVAGELTSAGSGVLAVAISGDGHRAASSHFDTILRLWTYPAGEPQGELHGHKQMVTGVAFLPDGESLLSSSQDHTMRWWDLHAGTARAVVEHKAGIHALAVAGSCRLALTGDADQTLHVLEIPRMTDPATRARARKGAPHPREALSRCALRSSISDRRSSS